MSGMTGAHRTLAARFRDAAQRHASRDFIHVPAGAAREFAPAAVTLTYAQAAVRVDELRQCYAAAGYGRGHRIALALDNRPDFFLHLLALNGLGASVVPLNGAMTREELGFVLNHSDSALAVAHEGHEARLRAALPAGCRLANAAMRSLAAPQRPAAAAGGEVALVYTSGTTGTPKGCILDEMYFEFMGTHYVGIGGYCAFRPGEDRLITPLPVTHMNALACSFLAMLFTGGCLVQLDRFHTTTWWDTVRESRATCFHYLGVMPAMLLAAPLEPEQGLGGRVRFGFGAGADPKHHAAFEARFGVPLVEAWAMTETGGGAWITASREPRHVGQRCFGRAPPGLEWRLVDEAGRDVAPGAAGELLVRRAGEAPRQGFFAGYYKDAAATEAAWAGGWFHTGDIVRVGADQSFFFIDRRKNIIRRSGENIAAVEVESCILQVPGVAACAVTAVSDELRGEEVFAFVVPAPGRDPDQDFGAEIQSSCRRRLAYFKAPGYVAFVAGLPQTASQKLSRGEVKRRAASMVESGGAFDLRAAKKRPASRGA
jgi:acyl-CoA synthetase (AMP-forming)/AMP-acid ligase II